MEIKRQDGNITQWVPLTDNFPGPHTLGAFVVNKTDSDKILIGPGDSWGDGNGYIYRTHNQGGDWGAHKLPDWKDEADAPRKVWRMAEDVTDRSGDTILIATDKGIFRTQNFGLNWKRVFKG